VRQRGGYAYFNAELLCIHATSVPKTDEEALDYFTRVASWWPHQPPKFIAYRDHDSIKLQMMPYDYDASDDTYGLIGGVTSGSAQPQVP
jgi:hypothetical protein